MTANSSVCAGVMYYITFEAREKKRRHDRVVKTFQAKVWKGIGHKTVKFCRLKKMPDQKVLLLLLFPSGRWWGIILIFSRVSAWKLRTVSENIPASEIWSVSDEATLCARIFGSASRHSCFFRRSRIQDIKPCFHKHTDWLHWGFDYEMRTSGAEHTISWAYERMVWP